MSDRKICEKENPMPKNAEGRWQHVDAVETNDSDYWIEYTCPHCDKVFKVEMPD